MCFICYFFFFFKQKTAYEMRISDWSSDVCSSDLGRHLRELRHHAVDVVLRPAIELRRQGVGAEVGGLDRHRLALAEAAGDAQHLHLVLEGQAVAVLDLDGGHALGGEVAKAGTERGSGAGGARGSTYRGDAAGAG